MTEHETWVAGVITGTITEPEPLDYEVYDDGTDPSTWRLDEDEPDFSREPHDEYDPLASRWAEDMWERAYWGDR